MMIKPTVNNPAVSKFTHKIDLLIIDNVKSSVKKTNLEIRNYIGPHVSKTCLFSTKLNP
jgi:hypothetical protein